MNLFTPVFAMALGLATTAAASTFGPLVEAEDLSAALADTSPVLLDIRAKGFEAAHAEGAVSAPYGLFRGPKENPGALVDVEELEAQLELRGLELDDPIVILTDGKNSTDFGAAARVYWTLKSTGFTDLSILNGGVAAWSAAGLPMSSDAAAVEPSELELSFDDAWLAETDDVAAVAKGDAEAVLVDARLAPFYTGDKAHGAARMGGTAQGAVNHAFTEFFEGDAARISPVADVAGLKSTLGLEEGGEVISFCNTGHWAATHWFAVSELAGIENAKLYAASMVEYSNAGAPMENTPGLLQNLMNQVTK
jgi:thiosulfate/3-mercaptopyruvate sulfurtransferase